MVRVLTPHSELSLKRELRARRRRSAGACSVVSSVRRGTKSDMLGKRVAALSWSQLSPLAARWSAPPGEAGPTSAQSRLRLFGAKESDVRVTLYRDNHAWCASATAH